ncbi:unnamed protein product, partial [Prorocentrum cordatum]
AEAGAEERASGKAKREPKEKEARGRPKKGPQRAAAEPQEAREPQGLLSSAAGAPPPAAAAQDPTLGADGMAGGGCAIGSAAQDGTRAAADVAGIDITFSVAADVEPGVSVRVVGSADALGRWEPEQGVRMHAVRSTSGTFWSATARLPGGSESLGSVEYKFVKVLHNGDVTWEGCGNRKVSVTDLCAARAAAPMFGEDPGHTGGARRASMGHSEAVAGDAEEFHEAVEDTAGNDSDEAPDEWAGPEEEGAQVDEEGRRVAQAPPGTEKQPEGKKGWFGWWK